MVAIEDILIVDDDPSFIRLAEYVDAAAHTEFLNRRRLPKPLQRVQRMCRPLSCWIGRWEKHTESMQSIRFNANCRVLRIVLATACHGVLRAPTPQSPARMRLVSMPEIPRKR